MAPLFIAAGVSHLGWVEGRMPDVLLIAAQILIGSALGAQFRPAFLTRLFRLLWASCLVVLFAAGAMALFAAAFAWLAGYPMPTMVLAMAPAGIAEMVLTGKVLGLDATLIAGFQLMRIIIVLIWCRTALVLFHRLADDLRQATQCQLQPGLSAAKAGASSRMSFRAMQGRHAGLLAPRA